MRSPLLRLAAGLILLAACDGKRKYPTEYQTTGAINRATPPAQVAVAADVLAHTAMLRSA